MNTVEYVEAYYVDPENGSDRNPGTFDRPFRTIQHSIDVAGENENDSNQIFLREGVYYPDQPIEINQNGGTKEAFLTIQPLPGEEAIIDGSEVERGGGLIEVRNVRRVNIVGLEIRNAPSHGIEVVNGKYINLVDNLIYDTQSMGIRVRGAIPENSLYEGDTTSQSSDIVIEGNQVYQTNLSNSGENKGVDNWGAGIQAWNADNVVIVRNTVGENYGEGIGLSLVDDAVVAQNYVYDSYSVQVYLDNVTDSLIESNFVYNSGDRRFYRDSLPANGIGLSLVDDAVVAQNYVYDSYSVQVYLDNVTDSLIESNFVYNSGDRRFYRDSLPANGIALANEIYDVAEPQNFYLDDNLIQRNIIVGADTAILYGTWAGIHQDDATNNFRGLRNTTIAHNTIYDANSASINFFEDPNTSNVSVEGNIFHQDSDSEVVPLDSLTGVDFGRNLWFGDASVTSNNSDDTIITEPLFANPGSYRVGDYQLQTGSSAIDVVPEDSSYWVKDNLGDLGALELGEPIFEAGDII
ncbi:MAG: right-handed parallel beta-helix repeat-containing protein [Cyanobacteria bacterium J06621_12]